MNQIQSCLMSYCRCRGGENTKPVRNFSMSNASSLERRVRKELEDQGILDNSEHKEPADDEILTELKRCQAELKVSIYIYFL